MYASRSLGLNTVPYHIIQHASYTDTVTYADMEKRVRASNRLTQRHTRVTQLVKKQTNMNTARLHMANGGTSMPGPQRLGTHNGVARISVCGCYVCYM